jgi:DNA helicase-2/ATP-dependent DNA helicase PcrA
VLDLSTLNPPQQEAVLHEGGPLVVFAGAGSGKTRVITHRVAHLVSEQGAAAWNILAVTFTNRAAGEMKERLGHMLGGSVVRDLWVGTFHATCARILRKYAAEVGIKRDFTIYDDADQRAMVKRVLRDLGLVERMFSVKAVQGRINGAKQEVVSPDAMLAGNDWEAQVVNVYRTYEERMRASGALDFDDLIYRLVVAIEGNDALRLELSKRFRHLLVDEFQDTNHAQYRLVRAIAAQHRNVTVVGDDDQSIYRWRGADRRNILGFRDEFPDARVVKLEQNYRSTKRILRAANAVIGHNADREPKRLWTDNEEGGKIIVVRAYDEREEADLIVRAVMEARTSRQLTDMAVFYRRHSMSRVLEEALRGARIPYRIYGGTRFYDRAEVKDLLAYLRLISNPDDDVSLLRVINTPPRGIGKKSVEQLMDRAAQNGTGVWKALEAAALEDVTAAKRLREFLRMMKTLRDRREAKEPLAAIGYAAFVDTGYEEWLREQDTPEADARKENIEELLGSMQELAEQSGESDEPFELEQFLELVTLKADEDAGEGEKEKLTLMTVHAAKGLEFPFVIVAGLEEGMFPSGRDTDDEAEAIEELEEERRLAYVAFTRARERLMLTWAHTRFAFRGRDAKREVNQPSRFLDELPPADVQRVGDPPMRAPAPRRDPVVRSAPAPSSSSTYVDRSEGSDISGVRVGMAVRHNKFGRGRVLSIKPSVPPRVDVQFSAEWGIKTIQLDYLQPA